MCDMNVEGCLFGERKRTSLGRATGNGSEGDKEQCVYVCVCVQKCKNVTVKPFAFYDN